MRSHSSFIFSICYLVDKQVFDDTITTLTKSGVSIMARTRINRTTEAAAYLAYATAFLLRSIFLPVTYALHTASFLVIPLFIYIVARIMTPRVAEEAAQRNHPFPEHEKAKVNRHLSALIKKYGLPLALSISIFSPVLAIFTSIARTLDAANNWGNTAYNFVAGDQDEILEATAVNDFSADELQEQNSLYIEPRRNTMIHQHSLQQTRPINDGQVFENDTVESNYHTSKFTMTNV
jgi:hypothetical protein